jgi:hypothetical protein
MQRMETVRPPCGIDSVDHDRGTILALNLSICRTPRVASSFPERPFGKPMKFSILDDAPACPPGPRRSNTTVETPSDAA